MKSFAVLKRHYLLQISLWPEIHTQNDNPCLSVTYRI